MPVHVRTCLRVWVHVRVRVRVCAYVCLYSTSRTLFWLVSDTAVDLIMWGTSYVDDKYQRFFKPHGTRYGKITALAAGHHRLIFADSLTQSLLLCPYKGGYRVDKANREQEKCTGEDVHVRNEMRSISTG